METETYKSAKVILEKYAPEQFRKGGLSSSCLDLTPVKTNSTNPTTIGSAGMFYYSFIIITYKLQKYCVQVMFSIVVISERFLKGWLFYYFGIVSLFVCNVG